MSKKSKNNNGNIIKSNQRQYLRDKVIVGAQLYKEYLMNKTFLIICENSESYEIVFNKKDFKHLTGIESNLDEKRFFENSVNSTLSESNIFENQHYNYQTLKSKADRIVIIDSLLYKNIEDSLFMVDLHTKTCNFPVAIRNSTTNACIGFLGRDNHARTLRKYSNSTDCKYEKKISAIFTKGREDKKYNDIIYMSGDISNVLTSDHIDKFSEELKDKLKLNR